MARTTANRLRSPAAASRPQMTPAASATFPKLDLFAAGPGGLPGTGPAQASAGSAPAELTISEFGPVAAAAAQTIGRLTAPDPLPVPTKGRPVSEPGASAARDAAVESCLRDE